MNKEQTALCQKLAQLLGYSDFIKIGHKCTGKWKGTTDYSLVFDGKTTLFISNGMDYFFETVKQYIQDLQSFVKNKKEMIQTISKQIEKDNLKAEQEGLLPVKFISLNINTMPDISYLEAYICMEVAGCQFNFVETEFNDAVFQNELSPYFKIQNTQNIYTAGAVQKPTFIFGNVRYSHVDKLYKL